METDKQKIRRLERELREQREISYKHEKSIDSLRQKLSLENDLWATVEDTDRMDTDTSLLHLREVIWDILHDDTKIAKITGFDMPQFEYLHDKFVAESKKQDDEPLFSEDDLPNAGNRCLLDRMSVLLLALFRKRSNTTQDALGVLFGTDQSTICRYLQFADSVLVNILPTATKITELIKRAKTIQDLKKIMPKKTIIIDGTEVPKQRPQDKDERKNTYSGKKKAFTINTTIISNKDGLIFGAGRSFDGGTHDLTMITEDPIDFGKWSKGMYDKDTPKEDRIQVLADKGYQGITKYYKGITVKIPEKKRRTKELTARQKKRNKKISSKRIIVEHAIGRIKQWARMTDPYDGTVEEFREELEIVTGLANFSLLWSKRRKRPSLDY